MKMNNKNKALLFKEMKMPPTALMALSAAVWKRQLVLSGGNFFPCSSARRALGNFGAPEA